MICKEGTTWKTHVRSLALRCCVRSICRVNCARAMYFANVNCSRDRGSNNKSYQNTSGGVKLVERAHFGAIKKATCRGGHRQLRRLSAPMFFFPSRRTLFPTYLMTFPRSPPRKSIVHITKLTADVNGGRDTWGGNRSPQARKTTSVSLKERERRDASSKEGTSRLA